jgi:hypothetical protein
MVESIVASLDGPYDSLLIHIIVFRCCNPFDLLLDFVNRELLEASQVVIVDSVLYYDAVGADYID